jgi:hypothetical protein
MDTIYQKITGKKLKASTGFRFKMGILKTAPRLGAVSFHLIVCLKTQFKTIF